MDNYGTHKTPLIRAWLAKRPRFHVHFTPTYGSWMNLVERWFSELTTKQIRRGAHRSVSELERAIWEFINVRERGAHAVRVDKKRRRDPLEHRPFCPANPCRARALTYSANHCYRTLGRAAQGTLTKRRSRCPRVNCRTCGSRRVSTHVDRLVPRGPRPQVLICAADRAARRACPLTRVGIRPQDPGGGQIHARCTATPRRHEPSQRLA